MKSNVEREQRRAERMEAVRKGLDALPDGKAWRFTVHGTKVLLYKVPEKGVQSN